MSAEDILEQISGIVDDDSLSAETKVYEIKDIIASEAKDLPFTTPRMRRSSGNPMVYGY